MNIDERAALATLRFNWAMNHDDLWSESLSHISGIHTEAERAIEQGVLEAMERPTTSPRCLVIVGAPGSGKSHMLAWARRLVASKGGQFIALGLLGPDRAPEAVAQSIVNSLFENHWSMQTQASSLLRRLTSMVGLSKLERQAILGEGSFTGSILDAFVARLRIYRRDLRSCEPTLRALALTNSSDEDLQEIGYSYLNSMREPHRDAYINWQLPAGPAPAMRIAMQILQLNAIVGPTVVGVDQLGALVSLDYEEESSTKLGELASVVAHLQQTAPRTLFIITASPFAWEQMRLRLQQPQKQFCEPIALLPLPEPGIALRLVEQEFRRRYAAIGFAPPYPTWPIRPDALLKAVASTPRQLFQRVDEHIRRCLATGRIEEFGMRADALAMDSSGEDEAFSSLDSTFDRYWSSADVLTALDPQFEDDEMRELLGAGLRAWIEERGPRKFAYRADTQTGTRPPVHARLRMTLDPDTEDEVVWSFRAISHTKSRALTTRLSLASAAAGISEEHRTKRRLVIVRNDPWPAGPAMDKYLQRLRNGGGKSATISENDLRTFAALSALFRTDPPGLDAWLQTRRPASSTQFLLDALTDEAEPPLGLHDRDSDNVDDSILLGWNPVEGQPLTITDGQMRRHTLLLGTGTGKTTIAFNVIRQFAERGMPTLVIDLNGEYSDLPAKLASETRLRVIAPRKSETGVAQPPLPDFTAMRGDSSDMAAAIDLAVATLSRYAEISSNDIDGHNRRSFLREAVTYYAAEAPNDRSFMQMLQSLPDGLSAQEDAQSTALELAQMLFRTASTEINGEVHGVTTSIDDLFTPTADGDAPLCLFELKTLVNGNERQDFLARLETQLFSYLATRSANERTCLVVIDSAHELAPAGSPSVSSAGLLSLLKQGGRRGLAVVLTTDEPSQLDTRVIARCGEILQARVNDAVEASAAEHIARQRGYEPVEPARLRDNEFWSSAAGGIVRTGHH